MNIRRNLTALCTLGASFLSFSVGAVALAATDLLNAGEGWKRLDVPNQPAAEFHFTESGELTVKADKSVAFLYRPVGNPTKPAGPVLSWRWRVDRNFPSTNLGAKGKDDRPLAIHLWFADQQAESVFGPFGWLFGYPHISHTITYVLGGNHPADSILPNPYYNNGVLFALRGRQIAAGRWYSEKRDIHADLSRAFPGQLMMKTLKYISISADTDDTGSSSLARIAALTLLETDRP